MIEPHFWNRTLEGMHGRAAAALRADATRLKAAILESAFRLGVAAYVKLPEM